MKLICYLSNGYPSIESSIEMADLYLENGCDIIEIDFPARNPYLDSAFIQNRMKQALAACSDYNCYMEGIAEIRRRHPEDTLFILVYEETIMEVGGEKFIDFCLENDFRDVIYIGCSNKELHSRCMERGLRISTYIPFHLPDEDVAIAKSTNGFIYLQSKPVDKTRPGYETLDKCIDYLRKEAGIGQERPIYCGVGVNSPEDVSRVKAGGGEGVFIGSTILKLHDDPIALKESLSELKAATI